MAEPRQSAGDPYTWDDTVQPSPEIRKLWKEVASGIDKNQTVVWKNAVESLDSANRYLTSTEEARVFIENYMKHIIGILVEQQPSKIGPHERNCVEESLELSVMIIAKDIKIQQSRHGECIILEVLELVLNRKKAYYKGSKGNWNVAHHSSGLPEIRLKMIDKFRQEGGFAVLAEYLKARIPSPVFPPLELLHQILNALSESVPPRVETADDQLAAKEMEENAVLVSRAVMDYITSFTEDTLRKHHSEVNTVRHNMQKIFDRLVASRRADTYSFYAFWRALILKLITSKSLPLRLTGWEQMKDLIDASHEHRPPPKTFVVEGAGIGFVNGVYSFGSSTTEDGYAQRGVEITYKRTVFPTEKDQKEKVLTLFRCTMRSQQKWWFLSEADEEQPGTDRDIDYYQHKSKEHDESQPPSGGWLTCRNAGQDPPPSLKGKGLMVPHGEEYNTLEHQLAKWAIENEIVEHVLGESLHREVVNRSTTLIEFLASMCERDEITKGSMDPPGPNAYCLKSTHLLLAWKTCTSKADAAVSEEIYHLIVSILHSLPNSLAVPLLQAVQDSLKDRKRNLLFEVAEFCGALAAASPPIDQKAGSPRISLLSDEARAEVLALLWAVLTHPESSSLRNEINLKAFVASELKVEPMGQEHREKFLESCTKALSAFAQQGGSGAVDEFLTLRIVKLTQFVLEACPHEQAARVVTSSDGALATLIFNELSAYLGRRKVDANKHTTQRKSSLSIGEAKGESLESLNERLKILRYVYGVSVSVKLSSDQLRHLWQLCSSPQERAEIMMFIAKGSSMGQARGPSVGDQGAVQPQQMVATAPLEPSLSAAFSDDVRRSAFLDLFCSRTVNWDELGEGAYESFQIMFKKLRHTPGSSLPSSGPALDALWNICLTAGNENVFLQAMKDLLIAYAAMMNAKKSRGAWADGPPSENSDPMETDESDDDFGKRMFNCLNDVKDGLHAGTLSSERSAERCMRILNAAVGQDGSSGRSITMSTIASLTALSPTASLADAVRVVPHGMRGQACYRKIGVMAKRTGQHAQGLQGPSGSNHSVGESVSSGQPRTPSTVRFPLDVHPLETLGSVKSKVAQCCGCRTSSIKPISVSGRQTVAAGRVSESNQISVVPDDSTVDQLGIIQGCEMVFVVADRPMQGPSSPPTNKGSTRRNSVLDLSEMFSEPENEFADKLFQTLLSVLEALPWREKGNTTHRLVWDFLLAMPTNAAIVEKVHSSALGPKGTTKGSNGDAMVIDASENGWRSLLKRGFFQRSVYFLQTIDAFLQPAPEVLSVLSSPMVAELEKSMSAGASSFRKGFIVSGGFEAVVKFFSSTQASMASQSRQRMANAAALRILKCCLFGSKVTSQAQDSLGSLDETGSALLDSLAPSADGLLLNMTSMVVCDEGISGTAVTDVLKFLQLLFRTQRTTESFLKLPDNMAQKMITTLLLWEGSRDNVRNSSEIATSTNIRKSMHDLILSVPILEKSALPWLIKAMDKVDVGSDSTFEYFDVLRTLVCTEDDANRSSANAVKPSHSELQNLGMAVCKQLLACPRPTNESPVVDMPTGVLCGCLKLLRALIENGGGKVLGPGTSLLFQELQIERWSEPRGPKGVLGFVSTPFRPVQADDNVLVDLMGALFDGFLSPTGPSSIVAICCDKESRQLGFDAVAASARSCESSDGYMALVGRINGIVMAAAPVLRHRWGQFGGNEDGHSRSSMRNPAKYSGLRNQGCTCYMNSFLQQLFMMPKLRSQMCAAPLPTPLRTSGGASSAKGRALVGRKISLQWDTGVSYDAMVEGFSEKTGMHAIRYLPMPVATFGTTSGGNHHHVQPEDIARIPQELPEEFFLSEGRPGKETGAFEIIRQGPGGENTGEGKDSGSGQIAVIQESEEESAARHLLEEVQRTFIHLDEGSRGRCFDPRALVEACACLKLEFDVWQQNDASEFAMKLLDRMETALKRWAPSHLRYLDQTFGLKQTKQKICKECGLKTDREENLMSIDCQIRGKTNIHEALETMCEVEYMEGNNKVFCDRCRKNTDTVLRTAISALPDVLILSLKRFDLDYNTFETVKLNSRLSFGQTLNMKRYTLEGVDALEKAKAAKEGNDPSPMETDETEAVATDPLSTIPDDDYEYKLVGVLVHAGVAQGGHYYSFIKDRSNKDHDAEKWYRFDDEDVTPFDPASIETECFGGKVKKETKWANGHVQSVESEQFANALMLFYEKVLPVKRSDEKLGSVEDEKVEDREKAALIAARKEADRKVDKSSGYDAFEPDVRRSNTTHRWQTFLFDGEFQAFLKGLLGLCRVSRRDKQPAEAQSKSRSWQNVIIDMLLSFFFDVYLYSSDKSSLQAWVNMLCDTLFADVESSRLFVHKLATKSRLLSENWLRTYLSDCPESDSRAGAVRVFCSALLSCMCLDREQGALSRWIQAAGEQNSYLLPKRGKIAIPTSLISKWAVCEDLGTMSSGESSSIGIIISFITVLLEVAPRTWRFNADLCALIRDVAQGRTESSGQLVREAMTLAQIPARLIALAVRDKAPLLLRTSFPGASVAVEVIETQTRTETNPNAHLLPLTANQMMTTDKAQTHGDNSALLEALARFVGVSCLSFTPIIAETTEPVRGRPSFNLSEHAQQALTEIYQESCGSNANGMGQMEIEHYLRRCGVDSSAIPTQKIVDMMAKYPSTNGNGPKSSNLLSLEGFLTYYREIAQSQENRVRSDLHSFGYRPDLSCRPHEARFSTNNGQEQVLSTFESVGMDVAGLIAKEGKPFMNELTILGLEIFDLFMFACSCSEPLAQYLISSVSYNRSSTNLINSTLRALRRARAGWPGNVFCNAAVVCLKMLASIPDDYQDQRISSIMTSAENAGAPGDQGDGLLRAAKAISDMRQAPTYSNDIQYTYDRYLDIIKDMWKIGRVQVWMTENRQQWSWMERDLFSNDEGNYRYPRGDYIMRRDGASQDAETNNIHDSDEDEEDDDDSPLYEDSNRYLDKVSVDGAGKEAVNGVYVRDGDHDFAAKFVRRGEWNGSSRVFSLFRCNVSNNTKHWYISIVPDSVLPGTNKDIDFYSAPIVAESPNVPPSGGWMKAQEGRVPPPTITIVDYAENEAESRSGWNGGNGSTIMDQDRGHSGGGRSHKI